MALTCSFDWLLYVLYQLWCWFRLVNSLSKILPRWIWIKTGEEEQERTPHNFPSIHSLVWSVFVSITKRSSRRLLGCRWMLGLFNWSVLQPPVVMWAAAGGLFDALELQNFTPSPCNGFGLVYDNCTSYLLYYKHICFIITVFWCRSNRGLWEMRGMQQGTIGQNAPGSDCANEALCQQWEVLFNLVVLLWRQLGRE